MTYDDDALSVTVLDVGHGNSAVLRHGDQVAVVDAPRSNVLSRELDRHGLTRVDHLLLSHTDADHIGGATALLSSKNLAVRDLWFNPDSVKDSATFEDLATLAFVQHEAGQLRVNTNLNTGAGPISLSPRLALEILHPDVGLASHGPRTARPGRPAVSANTASVVVRVLLDNLPAVLLCADMDHHALQRLIERDVDLHADVLVFPHHGGSSHSGDDRAFARLLSERVAPRSVVFSHGRHRWRNPLTEVVAGVRDSNPAVRVACTQLSRNCHAGSGPFSTQHLSAAPAAGRPSGVCCAGSLVLSRGPEGTDTDAHSAAAHQAFISANAPQAMCRR